MKGLAGGLITRADAAMAYLAQYDVLPIWGIQINNCNRMSLMLRRAPSKTWLSEEWQNNMKQIEDCIDCRKCVAECPYDLDIPNLLRKNYEDYKQVLAGEVSVS